MPRKPRIDHPGLLYHVTARGIEGRHIYADDCDRLSFLDRLGELALETGISVYTFVLMPNHFHLLIGRDRTPVATFMQRLLTAHAVKFNKRHQRAGHLFQNRYKSIVCQDNIYFLELVRYINLNPVRAKIVSSIDDLSSWRFASHSCIVGRKRLEWFNPALVLSFYGTNTGDAQKAYKDFIAAGEQLELQSNPLGNGLKCSLGLSAGRQEGRAYDERLQELGEFMENLVAVPPAESSNMDMEDALAHLVVEVCRSHVVTRSELTGSGRARAVSCARACLAARMTKEYGLSRKEISRRLNVSHTAVAKMLDRSKHREGSL